MSRWALLLVGLMMWPSFVSAGERFMSSQMVGTNFSTATLVADIDRRGNHQFVATTDTRGFTDARLVTSYRNILLQQPGLGFRFDHHTGRPSAAVVSLADQFSDGPGQWIKMEGRLMVIFTDEPELSIRFGMMGRPRPSKLLYIGMYVDSWTIPRSRIEDHSGLLVTFQREPFGFFRLSAGLKHIKWLLEDYRRPEAHFESAIQFERQLMRLR